MNNLSYLNLTDNKITDISPLLSLDKLRTCYLSGNPLNEKSKNEYALKLKNKGVDLGSLLFEK